MCVKGLFHDIDFNKDLKKKRAERNNNSHLFGLARSE